KNAKKSMGPRTKRGKFFSSRNAWKHGLFAQAVVMKTGPGQEDWRKFRDLHERLVDELKPVGAVEELTVEQIAVCYVRLQRVMRYERGEISETYDREYSPVAYCSNYYHDIYKIFSNAEYVLTKARKEVLSRGAISPETYTEIAESTKFRPERPMPAEHIR